MVLAADVAKPALDWADVVIRFAAAVALAGAIGVEREISGQPAGLRTHVTLGLGAALFGLISVHGFDAFVASRNAVDYSIDVSRVASQVVVGVGFLGAGAILKEGASIRGLTTAASLWATAAVGLACGLGSFFAATAAAVALILSLVFLRAPRGWVRRRLARSLQTVVIHARRGSNPSEVVSALHEIDGCDVRSVSIRRDDDGLTIEADLKADASCDLEASLGDIASRKEVTGLDLA